MTKKKKKVTKKKVAKKKTVKKIAQEVTLKTLPEQQAEEMIAKLNGIATLCIDKMKDVSKDYGIKLDVDVLIKDVDKIQ